MEDKLRKYIDGLFSDTIPAKKAVELKEEMIQNLEDKYKDLISEGKTPEAAYNIAVAGIGDVSSLLDELEKGDNAASWQIAELETSRRKSAMLTSIAVMIYILSILPLIILSLLDSEYYAVLGLPLLLVFVAVGTGILVYNSMTKPRFKESSDTMVDDFRRWQSGTQRQKALRGAISWALWSIIVIVYFIVSFTTFAWYMTWIIFVIGVAIEALINIFTTVFSTSGK